jgi:F0F1-type ATP synthase assembly protein I
MKIALRIALYQLLLAVIAAAIWGVAEGLGSAASGFCGGLISATLTFYAALKVFGTASSDPEAVVMNFYRAEARKWALAVVLFGLAVWLFADNFVPLATTFAGTLTVYWFALLWKS